MNNQPFYVGTNSRFRGVSSDGYLPALEPYESEPEKPVVVPEHKLYKKIQELRGMELNTRMKLQEHLKEKKEAYTIGD